MRYDCYVERTRTQFNLDPAFVEAGTGQWLVERPAGGAGCSRSARITLPAPMAGPETMIWSAALEHLDPGGQLVSSIDASNPAWTSPTDPFPRRTPDASSGQGH